MRARTIKADSFARLSDRDGAMSFLCMDSFASSVFFSISASVARVDLCESRENEKTRKENRRGLPLCFWAGLLELLVVMGERGSGTDDADEAECCDWMLVSCFGPGSSASGCSTAIGSVGIGKAGDLRSGDGCAGEDFAVEEKIAITPMVSSRMHGEEKL